MKYYFFLVLVAFIASTTIAQDKEYAITLKNDTIYGKVIISSNQGLGQQILVKNGKKKTNFKVYQLKSINTKRGIYHTLKIKGQYQMAKLEKAGYLSYYNFSGNSSTSSLLFDTPILIKRSGEQMEIPNLGFKKHIARFLSDCDNVSTNFENGVYSKGDLNKIIDDYNQCIADRTVAYNDKNVKFEKSQNKADQIDEIIKSINSSSKISDKKELLEMLGDVKSKLKSNEKVPRYLIGALNDKLASEPQLLKQLLEVIQ